MASRGKELLIDHNLLNDSTYNVNDKPFRSEFKWDAKALSPKKRQCCDFPDHGLENNDNDRPAKNALEEKEFDKRFHLTKY